MDPHLYGYPECTHSRYVTLLYTRAYMLMEANQIVPYMHEARKKYKECMCQVMF